MKKSLLALAVLGAFAGSALAQSSVTLYGVADANLQLQRAEIGTAATGYSTQSLTSVASGGLNGSRFGLRGTEDLGGGLKATFVLENGYNIDTGTTAQSGTNAGARLFGRQAWVGFGGGFGDIRLGRQYTPIGVVADQTASLGTKGADLFAVTGALAANTTATNQRAGYRTDNAITYLSPNFGGVTAQVQYATRLDGGEQNKPNNKQGRQWGLNTMYAGGPIKAGIGYMNQTDGDTAIANNQKSNSYLAYFGWDFGFMSVLGAFNRDDIKPNVAGAAYKKRDTLGFDFGVPVGPVKLNIGLGVAKNNNGAADNANGTEVKDDVGFFTFQAVYSLSKRTALYGLITGVSNESDGISNRGYNGVAAGKNSAQYQFGVRHFF
jgi:general bacterial porin, GBP family